MSTSTPLQAIKWLLALLVSAAMFYAGYQHASRYETEAPAQAQRPAPIAPPPVEKIVTPPPAQDVATIPEPEPEPVAVSPDPTATVAEPEMVEEPQPAGNTDAFSALEPLDFQTAEARDRADSPAFEQALAAALESGNWTAYRDYLRASLTPFTLATAKSARDLAALRGTQRFARAHSQERFLTRFDQAAVQKPFANREFARWLLANNDAMDAAYDQITDRDQPAALVEFLADLFQETRDDLASYTRLAIACSLVYDSEQGAATNRFFWYVQQDKAGHLYRDPKSMPVGDLCLVVGGIGLKELDWVQEEYRKKAPRTATGKVYADIKYRMDFVTGETDRNTVYAEYTLAEIKEHGGVCSDQTHFAANVCRALGIPAVGLSGSGNRGAHAWVGYQDDDGTWATFGRYEDYANGSFDNPQTRSRVIESELALRSEPEFRSPARLGTLRDNFRIIDQLADAGQLARATDLAQQLLASNRAYLPGWEKLFDLYGMRRSELTGDGPLTSKEVVATIRDFEIALKAFPDLLGRADDTLSTTLAGVLDTDTQLKIIKRRRHRVESTDEARLVAILQLIRQEADIFSKAGDYDAVTALYRRELRTDAGDVQHFMKLAADYWDISQGDPARAKSALQLISSQVKDNFGDNLKSSDWFTRDTAIKPHAQLATFYRAAGEGERADKLERDLAKVRDELSKAKS